MRHDEAPESAPARPPRAPRVLLGGVIAGTVAAALILIAAGDAPAASARWVVVALCAAAGAAGLAAWRTVAQLQRRAEQRDASLRTLHRSHALLSTLVAASPDQLSLTDLESGHYVMVNRAFCHHYGWTEDEVIGKSALDLGIWSQAADRDRVFERVCEGGPVVEAEVELRTRDGKLRSTLLSASRISRDGRSYWVVNGRDIGQTVRERQEREAILDNASVGIAFTRGGHFALTNLHFDAIFGWPRGQLVGRPASAVWPDAQTSEEIGTEVRSALRRGDAVQTERWTARPDGTRFIVSLRAKALDPQHPRSGGTIWIAEDVTAQREAEDELARARDAAEAASRAKSAFLANTSHEIRTPLNGLLGLARLARGPGLDPLERAKYLDQIADSAQTLAQIISDILDFSKIEAGRLDLESSPFDLGEMLASLVQAYTALAAERALSFGARIDPNLPQVVLGDPLRVRQILVNYLHNALKFTAAGGIRLVVGGGIDDLVRFEVHDTGVGIDPQVGARLFQPFTQGDESTTRRFGGTGLGLAICHQLAILMGGRVGLDSAPGRGSCFWAELPLPAGSDLDADTVRSALDDDPLQGARVLLVEDNLVNMMVAAAQLEHWGMRVEQAADGNAALAAVQNAERAQQPLDVVLMDLQMPGMSGFEVTRRLRQREASARLPVIALTAAALVSERERAFEAGMDDFLTKPLDPRRMRSVLNRVLARSRV